MWETKKHLRGHIEDMYEYILKLQAENKKLKEQVAKLKKQLKGK